MNFAAGNATAGKPSGVGFGFQLWRSCWYPGIDGSIAICEVARSC